MSQATEIDLTVILCTYNRCDKLAEALASLAKQKVSCGRQWEVLLIDNNSSDRTVEVYQRFKQTFPVPLHYVFEAHLGLSYARNRGIAEARGRYVAFTEDDEISDERWVQMILNTFVSQSCDAVAGMIDLNWRGERPSWLTDEMLGFLGHLDYGVEQRLTHDRPPFGGNMAIAKSVFHKIGLFNTNLGRKGRKLIGGDEVELFERFFRAGFTAIYQPDAVTYHVIEKDRLKKVYFRKIHFYEGKTCGERYEIRKEKQIAGIPLFLLRQLYNSIRVYCSTVYDLGLNQSLRKEMIVWFFFGFLLGRAKKTWTLSRILRSFCALAVLCMVDFA